MIWLEDRREDWLEDRREDWLEDRREDWPEDWPEELKVLRGQMALRPDSGQNWWEG
jgi:hypothetical protein